MDELNKEPLVTPNIETPPLSSKNNKSIFWKILLSVSLLMIVGILAFIVLNKNTQEDISILSQDLSLSNIKARGTLIVGSSPPYGPMEFYDESNKMVGIDIDISNEIASAIGVKLQMVEVDFDLIQEKLNSGEIDIVAASMTITPERSKEMLFSVPYFNGGKVVVILSDSNNIKALTDLNNKIIGEENDGSSSESKILEHVAYAQIKSYLDSEGLSYVKTVVSELKNNKLDAFVVDYIAALDIVKNDSSLKILGNPFTEEYYGIATKIGNNNLINSINDTLRTIQKEGKIKLITDKWTK